MIVESTVMLTIIEPSSFATTKLENSSFGKFHVRESRKVVCMTMI